VHVGWVELHSDASLNFQLNRWLAYGGEPWLADVRPVLGRLGDYESWRATFLALGAAAEAAGRLHDAALHLRAAEFFMTPADARKEPTRKRLLDLFVRAAGVVPADRREVPFGRHVLPVYRFSPSDARGTVVLFGGFDSYVEELFPILLAVRDQGWDVVAFEGPGQGSVLEEQHLPMTPSWHRPVAAVLDALRLDDVTLVGVSLGGCLAMRAAAFEPRVTRVVAFDVLSDFGACLRRQLGAVAGVVVRAALATGARAAVDRGAAFVARRDPVRE
jgi:hypothetical protein